MCIIFLHTLCSEDYIEIWASIFVCYQYVTLFTLCYSTMIGAGPDLSTFRLVCWRPELWSSTCMCKHWYSKNPLVPLLHRSLNKSGVLFEAKSLYLTLKGVKSYSCWMCSWWVGYHAVGKNWLKLWVWTNVKRCYSSSVKYIMCVCTRNTIPLIWTSYVCCEVIECF